MYKKETGLLDTFEVKFYSNSELQSKYAQWDDFTMK